ncbi:uncharacterized protein LOC131658239 [Vicia villosa]|uniref:uncharacterized protein LOC131658239 n=1 Tax=Vicia villosa TaxID=3911 RepID=UPI00273A8B4C|nr:uncharacterized protein LOC131658239 [Vicia villosa]
MSDGEVIVEFFSKLVVFTNQMKSCGEKISEMHKVEKALRDIPAKFDHIVMSIEESKYLSKMKLEELQASLEVLSLCSRLLLQQILNGGDKGVTQFVHAGGRRGHFDGYITFGTRERMANILLKKKNGEEEIICDVLYSMESNLFILGQFLDKDYKIRLEEMELKVFDEMSELIWKASLSTNKTFKIMMQHVRPSVSCINHSKRSKLDLASKICPSQF